jgi:hypothetical protein
LELDRQLEVWRMHLPESLRFPGADSLQLPPGALAAPFGFRRRPVDERLLGFLKARYCAAKTLTHRPFVYAVLHAEDRDSVPDETPQKAALYLRSALMGPIHAGILDDPFPLMQLPLNPCRT